MTEQELKKQLDEAIEVNMNRWKHAPEGMDFHDYEWYMSETQNIVDRLSREYRLVQTPKMRGIPSYGDHMTLEEFVSYCKSGMFIDYDGSGNYATESQESNIDIHPSDVALGKIRKDFTHVVWYNK